MNLYKRDGNAIISSNLGKACLLKKVASYQCCCTPGHCTPFSLRLQIKTHDSKQTLRLAYHYKVQYPVLILPLLSSHQCVFCDKFSNTLSPVSKKSINQSKKVTCNSLSYTHNNFNAYANAFQVHVNQQVLLGDQTNLSKSHSIMKRLGLILMAPSKTK